MTDTANLPTTEDADTDQDDSLKHPICCLDDKIAICGRKMKGGISYKPKRGEIPDNACIVCLDIWRTSYSCPKGIICEVRYSIR